MTVKVGQIYKVCGGVVVKPPLGEVDGPQWRKLGWFTRPTIGIVRKVTGTNASMEIITGDKNWAKDNDGWVPFPVGSYQTMVLLPNTELSKILYS